MACGAGMVACVTMCGRGDGAAHSGKSGSPFWLQLRQQQNCVLHGYFRFNIFGTQKCASKLPWKDQNCASLSNRAHVPAGLHWRFQMTPVGDTGPACLSACNNTRSKDAGSLGASRYHSPTPIYSKREDAAVRSHTKLEPNSRQRRREQCHAIQAKRQAESQSLAGPQLQLCIRFAENCELEGGSVALHPHPLALVHLLCDPPLCLVDLCPHPLDLQTYDVLPSRQSFVT